MKFHYIVGPKLNSAYESTSPAVISLFDQFRSDHNMSHFPTGTPGIPGVVSLEWPLQIVHVTYAIITSRVVYSRQSATEARFRYKLASIKCSPVLIAFIYACSLKVYERP